MPGTQKMLIIAHFLLKFRTITHNSPSRAGLAGRVHALLSGPTLPDIRQSARRRGNIVYI